MVVETVRAVSRNMRHGAMVKGALREDVPDYPLPAVREAVANALMHRDYSPDGHGTPVMVDLYPDRLEVSNPGGLFGSLTVESLGTKGGTASRNQYLARILDSIFAVLQAYLFPHGGKAFPFQNLNDFLYWMEHKRDVPCSPKTYSRRVTSFKSFFRWLKTFGIIDIDPLSVALERERRGEE